MAKNREILDAPNIVVCCSFFLRHPCAKLCTNTSVFFDIFLQVTCSKNARARANDEEMIACICLKRNDSEEQEDAKEKIFPISMKIFSGFDIAFDMCVRVRFTMGRIVLHSIV